MISKKKLCDGCQIEKFIWKNHEGKKYCVGCWNRIKPQPVKPLPKLENASPSEVGGYKPMVYKKQKKVIFPKVISTKRKIEQKEYSIERYLYLVDHEKCEANIRYVCKGNSTEIHHKKGRVGNLYLDKKYWLACCHQCHVYIENNPLEARQRGWSISRLDIDPEDKD